MPGIPSLPTTLLPCLFRFIPFEAAEITRETGRRLVTHIFPNRDIPLNEDLGRKVRRWKIQGFVVGESADLIRDLMIQAVELEGPGPLIHFKLGLVYVRCESLEVRESVESGVNVVEFTFDFVESGAYFPVGILASAAALAKTAVTGAALGIVFATNPSPSPAEVTDRATLLATAAAKLKNTDASASTVAAFRAIASNAASLSEDPQAMIAAVNAAVATVTLPADLRALADVAFEPLLTSAGSNIDILIFTSLLIAAGQASISEVFPTWNDAIAVRDHLGDQFAALELYLVDADLFAAVVDLKGLVVNGISTEAVNLPRLRPLAVTYAIPAVVLAYSLYGDATRADEILARNNLSDPLAVAGDLQVLTE